MFSRTTAAASRWFSGVRAAALRWYDRNFRGGHIVLIRDDDVVYDGPRDGAPAWVLREWKEQSDAINDVLKSVEGAVAKARAKKKRGE